MGKQDSDQDEHEQGNATPPDPVLLDASRSALALLRNSYPRIESEHEAIVQDAHLYCLPRWDGVRSYENFVVWKTGKLAIDHIRAASRKVVCAEPLGVAAKLELGFGCPDDRNESDVEHRGRRSRGELSEPGRIIASFLTHCERNVPSLLFGADVHSLGAWFRTWLEPPGVLQELAEEGILLQLPDDFEKRLWLFANHVMRTEEGGHWIESAEHRPPRRRGEKAADREPIELMHRSHGAGHSAYAWSLERRRAARAIGNQALTLCGLPARVRRELAGARQKREGRTRERVAKAVRKALTDSRDEQ